MRWNIAMPVLATALALPIGACYLPSPVAHAVVSVAADGSYTLDGRPVAADELAAAISAKHPSASDLVVEIHASPSASAASLNTAEKAIRLAHGRVAFAGEDAPR
jgi:biopolymer transport protein ExbD